jgi:hypothetical protein
VTFSQGGIDALLLCLLSIHLAVSIIGELSSEGRKPGPSYLPLRSVLSRWSIHLAMSILPSLRFFGLSSFAAALRFSLDALLYFFTDAEIEISYFFLL